MENDNITNDENSKSEKYNMPSGMKREDIEAGADMSRSTEHASDKAEHAYAEQADMQESTVIPADDAANTPDVTQNEKQSALQEETCEQVCPPQQTEQHTLHAASESDADTEYVLSGNVEDFTYDLYVKKCAPEVRDALALLNMTSEWELRKMNCYPDTDDGRRLTKAAEELRMYVEQHCGSLRLFFTKYKGQYIFTTCILDAITYRLDISFDMIINRVNGLSNMDLLCYLLSNLHINMTLPFNFVSFTAANKERFRDYINGASYTKDVKEALLDIYEKYNFADLPNATLKESLIVFLKNYFVKFKEVFASVRDVFEKSCKEIIDEAKSSNELPGFINDFLFRKTIMQGKEHKIVTLEFLLFAVKISDYYGMPDNCLICAGYGCEESSYNYDAKIRIGNKIKYFASVNAEEILDLLSKKPYTVQEIVDALNVSKTCVYRLIKQFVRQNVLLKEKGDKYRLNKYQLKNIIKLLETYGGI